MALFCTVEPVGEPVTLAEVKENLRLTHASEDEFISGLIRAARMEVEILTGTALLEQEWRLVLDDWPPEGVILLNRFPVKEIKTILVYDQDGEPRELDVSKVLFDAQSRPSRLLIPERPAPGFVMNGIEIDFLAGFGASGTDVPDLLKRAILLLASHWFETRVAGVSTNECGWPSGFERLIAPYRPRRLG